MKKQKKSEQTSLLTSTGRPDGCRFSPVVRANTKFYGPSPAICVDVRFEDVDQLDALIAALRKLREFPNDGFDHIHLQDTAKRDFASAEVTFYRPSVKRDGADKACVQSAREFFKALPKN